MKYEITLFNEVLPRNKQKQSFLQLFESPRQVSNEYPSLQPSGFIMQDTQQLFSPCLPL